MHTPSASSSYTDMTVGEKGTRYKLDNQIGSGTFGVIYHATDTKTNEEVAVKLEGMKHLHDHLLDEAKVLQALRGGTGIPQVRWSGRDAEHNVMVMELLGPSLESLFDSCSRTFTVKTVLMLADQMITRVEYVHSKGYVHRDLNPNNFLMGREPNSGTVYLIDFGLAKKYYERGTHRHIPFKNDKSLTGTARYASVNSHKGFELSRRDDLESLGYIFIYFLKGVLPWQNVKAATKKQKFDRIKEIKAGVSPEKLCEGFPDEFYLFLRYSQGLMFQEDPDFAYIRQLFRTLFRTLKFENDNKFDWTPQESRATQVLARSVRLHQQQESHAAEVSSAGEASTKPQKSTKGRK